MLNFYNTECVGKKMEGVTDDMLQEVKDYAQWLSTQPDVKK